MTAVSADVSNEALAELEALRKGGPCRAELSNEASAKLEASREGRSTAQNTLLNLQEFSAPRYNARFEDANEPFFHALAAIRSWYVRQPPGRFLTL